MTSTTANGLSRRAFFKKTIALELYIFFNNLILFVNIVHFFILGSENITIFKTKLRHVYSAPTKLFGKLGKHF